MARILSFEDILVSTVLGVILSQTVVISCFSFLFVSWHQQPTSLPISVVPFLHYQILMVSSHPMAELRKCKIWRNLWAALHSFSAIFYGNFLEDSGQSSLVLVHMSQRYHPHRREQIAFILASCFMLSFSFSDIWWIKYYFLQKIRNHLMSGTWTMIHCKPPCYCTTDPLMAVTLHETELRTPRENYSGCLRR